MTDEAEPSLQTFRNENDDPALAQSNKDKALPIRAALKAETEEPNRK